MPYEFNLRNFFQDFNPSKFIVYICFLVFCILFSLRLEGSIQCSYYIIFLPLWIWKVIVIIGCSLGCYVWLTKPYYRNERDSHTQFRGMIISSSLQMLLLMFELMVCDKLNNNRPHVFWLFVFIPLFSISVVSTGLCIWCIRHGRSFELELLCSVNILQFIFLALKLDHFVAWRWVVIFIPAWLVLCISLICLVYAIILSFILIRSSEISADLKRKNITSAIGYTCVFLPLLVFVILLSSKLDSTTTLPYPIISLPLFISLLSCILMTFNSRATNHWWFGTRKDFCTFVLETFPVMQIYANTSYKIPDKHLPNNTARTRNRENANEGDNGDNNDNVDARNSTRNGHFNNASNNEFVNSGNESSNSGVGNSSKKTRSSHKVHVEDTPNQLAKPFVALDVPD